MSWYIILYSIINKRYFFFFKSTLGALPGTAPKRFVSPLRIKLGISRLLGKHVNHYTETGKTSEVEFMLTLTPQSCVATSNLIRAACFNEHLDHLNKSHGSILIGPH